MIEKLDKDCGKLQKKINELVDAVNAILDYAPLEMATKAEPTDQFEEERKWIGKLCKFWDDEENDYLYEILIAIREDGSDYPYQMKDPDYEERTMSFKHCVPVSEHLIYKGGNNE